MPKPNTARTQLAILTRLSQTTAAKLIGVSSRTLRDHVDAPRNDDGSYDGPALVAWWLQGRIAPPSLDEHEAERVLLATEHVAFCIDAMPGVLEVLDELLDRYGDSGLAEFARRLRDRLHDEPEPRAAESPAALLQIVVQCEECRRIRRGPNCVKAKPPAGHDVQESRCPGCE